MSRVHVEDVACHKPIEQHAQRGQVLLHRRRGELAVQLFHERGDVERLNVGELADAAGVTPLREASRRVQVRLAGVIVVDLGGEKLEDALRGLRRRRE